MKVVTNSVLKFWIILL